MWIWMALGSAFLLGLYDVSKKIALKKNDVLEVLFVATFLSTVFLAAWLVSYRGTFEQHLYLALKGLIVSSSWISGMVGLKYLPLTTASTLKASRPFFVVIFSIVLFGEVLNGWQWIGVVFALSAIVSLSISSRKEGIAINNNKGLPAMIISILTGVASALYDKHIMKGLGMEPQMVQSWGNFYISAVMGVCLLIKDIHLKRKGEKISGMCWDWNLILIAILITGADMLYFFALKQDGALLAVISLVRRCAAIVSFAAGAIFLKEKNASGKAVSIIMLTIGMVFLMLGSI